MNFTRKKIRKGVISLSIYIAIAILHYVAQHIYPSHSRFTPDNGFFVFIALMLYNPIATLNAGIRYLRGNKDRQLSLIVHASMLLVIIALLYPYDGSYFDRY